MADRRLPVTTGDLLLVIAMLLIYVEVLKVTRVSKTSWITCSRSSCSPPWWTSSCWCRA